jgi:hypothetical protein
MDPESKQLLEKTYSLVEENNSLLRKMRRAQRIASFMRAFYWLVIIGISIGAFYFLQPYIDQVEKFAKDSGATITQLKNLGSKLH